MRNISKQLFRTKDLSLILNESHDPEKRLKKALGAFDLVLLGIGVIIGAGIFATVGTAVVGDSARLGAGPALMVSYLITAVACGFAALCYAELASFVPISGSAYTYSYASFGELVAWIIGWDLMLEYSVGTIAVAISWAGYFNGLLAGFGLELPNWCTIDFRSAMAGFHQASAAIAAGTPLDQLTPAFQHAYTAVQSAPHVFGFPLVLNLAASMIVALLTIILVIGIKASSRFNIIVVSVKLVILALFIFVGFFYVKPENWSPFAPNGFEGIRAGAGAAFFAYIGFDCISTVSEETRNPKRDMPIGIIGSLAVCTIIYILVTAVFTGIIPSSLLASTPHAKTEPLAFAMQYINLNWISGVIAFGSIIAMTAVLLVLQLGQARIFFSMSRDGLIPQVFSKVHSKFKTPHVNTIIIGVIAALVASFSNIDEMVDLTNIGTLFAFVLVCFGVIILRIKEPHRHRGFNVPFNPVLPLAGVLSCIFVMSALPAVTWKRFVIWMALGLVVYFTYSIRHSRLHKTHHHKHQQSRDHLAQPK